METKTSHLPLIADANFFYLRSNPYPGRGIIIGLDESGSHLIHVMWLTGRSENSRNRLLSPKHDWSVRTEPADTKKEINPELIIYTAMRHITLRKPTIIVDIVSNGDQTDSVADGMLSGHCFHELVGECRYEHDAPHYTPRIVGLSEWVDDGDDYYAALAAIYKRPDPSLGCSHHVWEIDDLKPGYGYGLHTYAGNGYPLPTYVGGPSLLPMKGTTEEILNTYWEALNPENRISIAVKERSKKGEVGVLIRNKFQRV